MLIENRTERVIYLNVKDSDYPGGYGRVTIIPGDHRVDKKVAANNEITDVQKAKIEECAENALFFNAEPPLLYCHGGALKFPQQKKAA